MDARLLSELRLDRMKAHAIRLAHTIAASLAHRFINHHAQGWLLQLSTRTQTPHFRGALLVINDYGYTGHLLEFTHYGRQFIAIPHAGIGGKLHVRFILRQVVR